MKRMMAGLGVIFVAVYIITAGFGGELQNLSYQVDDWTEKGYVSENIVATEDLIYVESNSSGTWTSDIQTNTKHYLESAFIQADSTDGTITFTVNMWNGTNISGSPDKSINRTVNTGENNFDFDFNETETYDSFEFELELEKPKTNNQERPNVQQLEVELGSQQIDFRDFDNIFSLFGLLLLFFGLYAILS